MENPTVDNYYAFFKELVEKKPGEGKPSYALTAAGDIAEINFIFNTAFGLDTTWLKKEDGTYEYSKVSQKEKEKLTFYNKLYKEGLLTRNSLRSSGIRRKMLSIKEKLPLLRAQPAKSSICMTEECRSSAEKTLI